MNGSVAIVEATRYMKGEIPAPKKHFLETHEEDLSRKAEVMQALGIEVIPPTLPQDECIVCHNAFYKEHARQIYCVKCQPCGWCKHRGGKHAEGCKRKNAATIRASKLSSMKRSHKPSKNGVAPTMSKPAHTIQPVQFQGANPYLQVVEDLNNKIAKLTQSRDWCLKMAEEFGKNELGVASVLS